MSALKQDLLAQLARFDDDAYIALANRGLLRRARKDLETQGIAILEETPLHLLVGFGGQHIRFDARGPAHAQCNCSSGGVCQHILAACLALQAGGQCAAAGHHAAGQDAGVPVPHAPSADHGAGADILHQELLGLPREDLIKHAGKPGYRWAWQFVQDLDPDQDLTLRGGRHIAIGFRHPRMTFRYMGGGLHGLVANVQTAQLPRQQVAAVLAYRRVHGVDDAPLEAAGKGKTAALDLGKDHELADSAVQVLEDSRGRLRASVAQLLEDCVELGLSHLSTSVHERCSTMAVWAQGAEYYRMAALLRRIADHVEMLLERTGGADEHRLYDELALACGLVAALEAGAKRGSAPIHLVGRARSRYEETAAMELLGLGAQPWRSASGYVGLTMLFWSPAEKAFYACTDARPELQRAFNPVARYQAAGPWSGLGAPALATGRRVRLTAPKTNAQRRLSATEATSADIQPPGEEFIRALAAQGDWDALAEARALTRRSVLAEPDPMSDWVVLAPARFGTARFDEAGQKLIWPLQDESEAELDIELPYSEYSAHAIQRIEQLSAAGVPKGSLLVARLRDTAWGLRAEPLSLIRPHAAPGENPVDALYFDPSPKGGMLSGWVGRARAAVRGSPEGAALPVVNPRHPALREFKHWLQRLVERGFAREQQASARADFAVRLDSVASSGYSAFPSPGAELPLARLVLQANYTCLQYERLVDQPQEQDEQ